MGYTNLGRSCWAILRERAGEGGEEEQRFLFERLEDDRQSLVGMNYYFIRVRDALPSLCRISARPGDYFREEVLDHENHGISNFELEDALRTMAGDPCHDGCTRCPAVSSGRSGCCWNLNRVGKDRLGLFPVLEIFSILRITMLEKGIPGKTCGPGSWCQRVRTGLPEDHHETGREGNFNPRTLFPQRSTLRRGTVTHCILS